ncbi:putative _thioesterase family protein [Rutstroemia sp. NJR-2017a WRK4]|nr:putative _thioesterase family protein [Rutstroemia sp. NJR-2017a WRK4]
MVDLGGSLAVASQGLHATGVSTDMNITYLNSGGKVGDTLKAVATCDKCEFLPRVRGVLLVNDWTVGKTLAYTSIQFTNAKGQLAARGSHTK